MATHKVKLAMQKEAKKLLEKEYKIVVYTLNTEDGRTITIVPTVEDLRKADIIEILKNHPEFDPNTFRQMIKEFGKRNKNESRDEPS